MRLPSPTSGVFNALKFPGKTKTLLRRATRVLAINDLLGDYAAQFNPSVTVMPNCLDTDRWRPVERTCDGDVTLVWTGSASTVANLGAIAEPLARIQRRTGVAVRVVGPPTVEVPGLRLDVRQWTPTTEVDDIADCDVGLLPVTDEPWNRWKFFLKLVQYMAVGLPVVAQRIGSNQEVIEDGVNGFLVDSAGEWEDRLALLANDEGLRQSMGTAARRTVGQRYSLAARMPDVIEVFAAAVAA
jgi:glycosyltransferase involved in cell wall biosynthesis